MGKGVLKAVNNVKTQITPEILGMEVKNQKEIDNKMIMLDGTKSKSNLGANAMLAVSLACLKAAANEENVELYEYVGDGKDLPYPMMNILNGGAHADNLLDFQEFMILPQNKDFRERIRCGAEVFHNLKKVLKENDTYKGLRSIFLCFGIYLALIILALPATAMAFCIKLIRVAVILSIAKILVGMISPTSKLMKKVKGNEKLQENQKLIQTGTKLLKVLIYIVAGFMIISEFGYDLNGIITGLGLGSVVIALAAQELVSNLLSGMAIASEKPFEIGDWVTIGDISGTIVDIKFRSIKIKTVENTTVTIQNTKILSEAIIKPSRICARSLALRRSNSVRRITTS